LCGILLQSAHGFRFCEGSKFAISHRLCRSPLTQCWRYTAQPVINRKCPVFLRHSIICVHYISVAFLAARHCVAMFSLLLPAVRQYGMLLSLLSLSVFFGYRYISATVAPIGVKFCMTVHICPGCVVSPLRRCPQ